MKKILFPLAAVALLAVSCSQDETTEINSVPDPNAIGFEVGTGKLLSRSTMNDLTTMTGAQADSIVVFAYKKTTATPEVFIDLERYVYTAGTPGSWGWDSAITAPQWPAAGDPLDEYPIDFYAWYPDDMIPTYATAQAFLDAGLIIPSGLWYTDIEDQVDYLGARQIGVSVRPNNSNVKLDFGHMYSKVDFAVQAGTGATVEVQSIEIHNVGYKANFNGNNWEWQQPTTFATDFDDYLVAPVKLANTFNTTTKTNITSDFGSALMLPQDLTGRDWTALAAPDGDDSYIEVVYRVTETTGGRDVVGYTDAKNHTDYDGSNPTKDLTGTPLFVKVGYSINTEWEMGKAYTYVLHLGDPSKSGGNLIDQYYIDEDGDTTDLPVNITVPAPIYTSSYEIGIEVKVTDWDVQADTNL
ncbi:MAG: fimbrillin family protein [Rikenellaceae bacterium]|jgi:hypothetical protein|nr:fimbrillin family protein [Rikenellaceae bacterium]